MTEEKITIEHPDYGYVQFHGMTPRQMEILKKAKELLNNWKKRKKTKL